MGIEVARTRHATGQHQQIGIAEVAGVEQHVGTDSHTMGRLDDGLTRRAHRYHIHTSATQHVHGNQGLDILEAVCEKYINFCHILLFLGILIAKIVIFHRLS